jgi:hypothetical protein
LNQLPDLTREQTTTRMAVLAAAVAHWMVETGKICEFERWLTDQGQLPALDEKMRTNLAVTLNAIHKAGEPDCELTVPHSWPHAETG